ncbi:hypothetical protein HETIRDRAFT_319564 [Heterobasidion irregulare TC 32-1]|uniref:Zn(2)-C6 fungal-type domain-containing protein n=1 Tax=Heterobasidion irregulare (strain TC 32-1) TaxID=747525 RepID=W4K6R5_HETIT|nr:uncharacterized protein HETIRDRAFT_319564 [Heterobasidion irregulare TC 32-1]ETW80751.1 hypothetical protein HETIRDRAFT_319564 [Heterobasidion irregulare TC 32-1]
MHSPSPSSSSSLRPHPTSPVRPPPAPPPNPPPPPTSAYGKKRKVERACDACRRRKTRCDGPKMPDNVCSTCISSRRKCTYMSVSLPCLYLAYHPAHVPTRPCTTPREASKPRGPPKA